MCTFDIFDNTVSKEGKGSFTSEYKRAFLTQYYVADGV